MTAPRRTLPDAVVQRRRGAFSSVEVTRQRILGRLRRQPRGVSISPARVCDHARVHRSRPGRARASAPTPRRPLAELPPVAARPATRARRSDGRVVPSRSTCWRTSASQGDARIRHAETTTRWPLLEALDDPRAAAHPRHPGLPRVRGFVGQCRRTLALAPGCCPDRCAPSHRTPGPARMPCVRLGDPRIPLAECVSASVARRGPARLSGEHAQSATRGSCYASSSRTPRQQVRCPTGARPLSPLRHRSRARADPATAPAAAGDRARHRQRGGDVIGPLHVPPSARWTANAVPGLCTTPRALDEQAPPKRPQSSTQRLVAAPPP